jgi:hypothetical protein
MTMEAGKFPVLPSISWSLGKSECCSSPNLKPCEPGEPMVYKSQFRFKGLRVRSCSV